ncbi:MAG TPA: type II toxin-antitoxin system VapC family toxin [Candidatus Saccharimonadales bacterium]|jgi:tRNA(fMet)-specific endonuclease VapC|nr:type II toxin-antitoxin system VapC family toxin [Candidatus Saccharimonadales bacterium]
MATQYLLDTNIASYIIKGSIPAVRRRLMRVPMAQVAISTVTEGELRYGMVRLPGATQLQKVVEEFLLRVTILPWDSEAARQYGHLRASLESAGQPMGNLDIMIGAHALSLGATLVTNDQAFTRIKKLKVENWTT